MDYIELTLHIEPKHPWTEILTGELADIGFESFMEENNSLLAYIQKEKYTATETKQLVEQYDKVKVSITERLIPEQNWNAVWESDFEPVRIDKRLLIKAPFHSIEEDFEQTIEIQPQMSFGTGHHQTTFLLSKVILDMDLAGKTVLDVGTGTGILGILAAKKDAKSVLGTDIEPGACENARENIARNNVTSFEILEGDLEVVTEGDFDVIFANINKNVLKKHLPGYALRSHEKSILLLSGFFESDAEELIDAAQKVGFKTVKTHSMETWAVLELKK